MKYRLGFLVLLAVIITSCNSFVDDTDYQASEIKGMATPIHLGPQFTEVVLSDYVMDAAMIDSLFIDVQHTWDKAKGTISIYNDYDKPYVDNLRLWVNGKANDIPVIRSQSQTVTLIYRNRPGTEKVQVKGSFSSWALIDMQLQNDYWTTSMTMRPMIHEYVLVVNGEEMPDPENPDTKPNGMGGTNSILNLQQEVDKFPALQYDDQKGDQFSIISETPDLNNVLVYYNNHLLPEQYVQNQNNEILIRIPKMPKKEKETVKDMLRVFASNEYGKSNELTIPINNGRVILKAEDLGRKDMHANVLYFMMVDRFVDGNPQNTRKVDNDSIADIANYFGGDLQGVVNKIEDGYFESLNINNIWLSPITQNPEGAYGFWPNPPSKFSGYHGYWPISNIKIDDRFGDDETLTKLIDAAHDKGMNVILDYVANHVHKEHP
ncbi:MAG: alpha-amylase family glycosyl hydrolase, partial [Flavobacteriaceae bacterium]|nr:alpha-amylase family glycosyl hydrolase [Flavobacteriaceae bacterium]